MRDEQAHLEERGALVDQLFHPLASRELALGMLPIDPFRTATLTESSPELDHLLGQGLQSGRGLRT